MPGYLSVAATAAALEGACFHGTRRTCRPVFLDMHQRASERGTSGAPGAFCGLQKAAGVNFISRAVLMRLRGNETDDSCGTFRPGRSKRSLRRHRSIISRLTPRKLPAAHTSHLSQRVCSGVRRYGRGAQAGGQEGSRVTAF